MSHLPISKMPDLAGDRIEVWGSTPSDGLSVPYYFVVLRVERSVADFLCPCKRKTKSEVALAKYLVTCSICGSFCGEEQEDDYLVYSHWQTRADLRKKNTGPTTGAPPRVKLDMETISYGAMK